MRTRSKGESLFLLEIGLGVLISFDSHFFFFWKSISLFNPLPHLITNRPVFPFLARLFIFLQFSILFLSISPVISLCLPPKFVSYPVSSSFCPYYMCLNMSLVQRKKDFFFFFFFLLSAIKPKETRNVYFSYDIFLMLLSDRNLEK